MKPADSRNDRIKCHHIIPSGLNPVWPNSGINVKPFI